MAVRVFTYLTRNKEQSVMHVLENVRKGEVKIALNFGSQSACTVLWLSGTVSEVG